MVKININIQKKDLWLISAIFVFLLATGLVVAYNANMDAGQADVMGHSAGELHVENSTGSVITLQELVDQGGIGGSCGWKELPQTDCDVNGLNCKGKIMMEDLIDEGYTGACYFNRDDNGDLTVGTMATSSSTTENLDDTYVYCFKSGVYYGTNTGYLNATHKAYYRYCD